MARLELSLEIAKEKKNLKRNWHEINDKYPLGGGVRSLEVDKKAEQIYKRLSRKDPFVYKYVKDTEYWKLLVELLKYHKVDRWIDKLIEEKEAYKGHNKTSV